MRTLEQLETHDGLGRKVINNEDIFNKEHMQSC
jgi:hypothetical protein